MKKSLLNKCGLLGIVFDTRENIFRMLHETGVTYLRGLGVDEKKILILTGGEPDGDKNT